MQVNNKHMITVDEVVSVAQEMKEKGATLGMIHGHLDKEGKKVVTYDYFLGNAVESYEVADVTTLPTVSGIWATSASWPEIELHELIGVDFEGLDMTQRLFLPADMLDGKGQIFVTPMSELRENNLKEK